MKANSSQKLRPGRFYPHILPVLVWLGTVAVVLVLFQRRAQRFEVLGMAQSRTHQIAATCTGRLKSIPVSLYSKVSQGQTLAEIDTLLENEPLQAQLATASSEIERLRAELSATEQRLITEAENLQTNWVMDNRRFSVDVENARLRILELKTLIETDLITLKDLELEVKIVQGLRDDNAVSSYELQKAVVAFDTLATQIEENLRLLNQGQEDLKEAQRRQNEFAQHQPQQVPLDSELNVIRKSIKVQEQIVEELLAKRVALVLSSPVDGEVSQILHRPGEAVLAGEPILVIAEIKPFEIIAYAADDQVNQIHEGAKVELIKYSERQQITESEVSYVGPIVEQMPIRLWQNPNIPQWGRPFLVKVPPQMQLTPGELIGIRRL